MLKNFLSTTRIPVASIFDNPDVAKSAAFGATLAADAQEAEAEERRLAQLKGTETDLKARAEMRAAGREPPPNKSTAQLRADVRDSLAEKKMAVEIHQKKHATLLATEGNKLRQSLLPEVEAVERRIAAKVVEVVEDLLIIEQVRRDLWKQQVGWYGAPVRLDTDRIFTSLDRACDAAQLLRQAVSLGYIKSLPREWA